MSETHLHALPAGSRLEEYEIVRVLGAGGFGITYLAFDHTLDGPVAIKEYFPAGLAARIDDRRVAAASTESRDVFAWGLDRFLDEARTMHRFRHPNVVRAHRVVEAHGTAYIVMEYVEGEALAAILESRGRLPAAAWRRWLDPLLDGLAHIHGLGYLHRDIKPANIVVRAEDSEPVLIDFGAARAAARDRTHTRVLTPEYAPIEQHSSQAAQGPPTDIYALAAVSCRALTGAPPPSAPDRMLDDRYEPLVGRVAGADRAWLAALDLGLALRPQDRPQTVAAWHATLRGGSDQPALGHDSRAGSRTEAPIPDAPTAPVRRKGISGRFLVAGAIRAFDSLVGWTGRKKDMSGRSAVAVGIALAVWLVYATFVEVFPQLGSPDSVPGESPAESRPVETIAEPPVRAANNAVSTTSGGTVGRAEERGEASPEMPSPSPPIVFESDPITTFPEPPVADQSSPGPTTSSARATEPDSAYFTRGSHQDDVLRIQGTPDRIDRLSALGYERWRYGSSTVNISMGTHQVLEWSNSGRNLNIRFEPGSNTTGAGYFTRGSHQDDVLRIQGTPDRIDRLSALGYERWRYGSSTVNISMRSQQVLEWSNSGRNLNIRFEPGSSTTGAAYFTRGSHQDDVLRIQGTPDRIDRLSALGYERWRYGSSTVNISMGSHQVLEWSNSGRNLNIRFEPGSNTTGAAYFTRGSHQDDVLRIQGTPDRIDRLSALGYERWRYGSSTVNISMGSHQVLEWSNSGRNLNIRFEPGSNTTGAAYFTRGSHQDDVLRIQGTPDRIDRLSALGYERWRYGSSTVNISMGSHQVLEWSNSDRNLNVRLIPGTTR